MEMTGLGWEINGKRGELGRWMRMGWWFGVGRLRGRIRCRIWRRDLRRWEAEESIRWGVMVGSFLFPYFEEAVTIKER